MKFSDMVQQLGLSDAQSSLISQPACNPEITGVMAVDAATAGTISYIDGSKHAAQMRTTQASALILPNNDQTLQVAASDRQIAWISTGNPRLLFAQIISLFYRPFQPDPVIHPTAVIDPSVTLGAEVAIGAHVVIEANVTIGDGVCIHPNVVIYPDVQIGDRTVLHANCTIHERTQIGADCVIHSSAVIGAEGFGFVPTAEGWYKMQQSGYVVLEDGVEVGCHSAVDRPAVGETRVGRQTKLDNMVHIGHGSTIGFGCAFAAQVGLAGGVEIGNRVMLGGQVGIANEALVGDGAIATSKTGVHGHIKPGQVVSGYPCIEHKVFLRVANLYGRLPEISHTLKRLEKRLTQLEENS